jgi:hypothetical protein
VVTSGADEVIGDKSSTATLKGYRGSCVVYTTAAAPSTPAPAAAAAAAATTLPAKACVPNATQLCYGPGASSCNARVDYAAHANLGGTAYFAELAIRYARFEGRLMLPILC